MRNAAETTVLVVDDEPEIVNLIQSWIDCPEIHVLKANSADQAMDFLREAPVDILLTDIRMPGVDGFGLFRQAESLGKGRRPEVLLMTASYDPRRGEALATGVKGVIQKPFSSRELLSWLYYSVSPRFRPPFERKLRFPVSLLTRYGKSRTNLSYEGTVLNVSLHGILLGTNQWVPSENGTVFIRLPLPNREPIFVIGKTLWVKDIAQDARGAQIRYQVGLELSGSAETALTCFRSYVKELLGGHSCGIQTGAQAPF